MTPSPKEKCHTNDAFLVAVIVITLMIFAVTFLAFQYQHDQNEKSEAFTDCLNYQLAKYPGDRYANNSEIAIGFAFDECNRTFGGIY